MTCITIAITLFVAYVVILCVVGRRIPDSLSQTVFELPKTGAWLWTLVIFTVAVLTLIASLPNFPHDWQRVLAFIATFAIAIVAICPLGDKKDMDYHAHILAAYASGLFSQVPIITTNPWMLLAWVPWIASFVWLTKGIGTWRTARFWATMTCFASTFIFCVL